MFMVTCRNAVLVAISLKNIGNLELKIIDYGKISFADLEKIFFFIYEEKGKRFLKTGFKNIFALF